MFKISSAQRIVDDAVTVAKSRVRAIAAAKEACRKAVGECKRAESQSDRMAHFRTATIALKRWESLLVDAKASRTVLPLSLLKFDLTDHEAKRLEALGKPTAK